MACYLRIARVSARWKETVASLRCFLGILTRCCINALPNDSTSLLKISQLTKCHVLSVPYFNIFKEDELRGATCHYLAFLNL